MKKIKKTKKVKKKPKLSEKEQKAILIAKKAKKIRSSVKEKLDKFSSKHNVKMPCYPDGIKTNSKGELKSTFYYQHIYICKNICRNQCSEFLAKSYICVDIGCSYYPVCSGKSFEDRKSFCKKKYLYKERLRLNSLYNKYLLYYKIFRGLKTNPEQTLKYLKSRKEEEK
jgi:hypothetical protein